MLMLVGMGHPLGIRNPYGHEFGQKFIPVMGMGFLAGVFFLRGYEFGQVVPSGFLPIAISISPCRSAKRPKKQWCRIGAALRHLSRLMTRGREVHHMAKDNSAPKQAPLRLNSVCFCARLHLSFLKHFHV
jgi:hypothetical protein